MLPEARAVLEHDDLAHNVRIGAMSVSDAYERVLRRNRAHDDGKPPLDQAIMTADMEAAAPVLAEHADAIRTIGRRIVGDAIEVGRRLTECKALLQHGSWIPWLKREFGWASESTALNFMRVYRAFGSNPQQVTDLDLSLNTFYLLARPSTPEPIREEILAKAQHERISHTEVKRLVDGARGKQPAVRLDEDRLRDLVDRMADDRPDDPLVAELLRLLGR